MESDIRNASEANVPSAQPQIWTWWWLQAEAVDTLQKKVKTSKLWSRRHSDPGPGAPDCVNQLLRTSWLMKRRGVLSSSVSAGFMCTICGVAQNAVNVLDSFLLY